MNISSRAVATFVLCASIAAGCVKGGGDSADVPSARNNALDCPTCVTDPGLCPRYPMPAPNWWTTTKPTVSYPPTQFWSASPHLEGSDDDSRGHSIASSGWAEIPDYFEKDVCTPGSANVDVHVLTSEISSDLKDGTAIMLRPFIAPGADLDIIDGTGGLPKDAWNTAVRATFLGSTFEHGVASSDIATMAGSVMDSTLYDSYLDASASDRAEAVVVLPSLSITAWPDGSQWDQQVQLDKRLEDAGAIIVCTTFGGGEWKAGIPFQPCANANEGTPYRFHPIVVDSSEHSVATPIVAYAAALIRAARPSASAAEVRNYLRLGMVTRPDSHNGWPSLYIPCALNAAGIPRRGAIAERSDIVCPVGPRFVSGASSPISCANDCFLTGSDRATDGHNPTHPETHCATGGTTATGTDGSTCWTCGATGWSACASTTLPGCSATNHCYLTTAGTATDGSLGSHPETHCGAEGLTTKWIDGTGCWTCASGAWTTCASKATPVACPNGCFTIGGRATNLSGIADGCATDGTYASGTETTTTPTCWRCNEAGAAGSRVVGSWYGGDNYTTSACTALGSTPLPTPTSCPSGCYLTKGRATNNAALSDACGTDGKCYSGTEWSSSTPTCWCCNRSDAVAGSTSVGSWHGGADLATATCTAL